MRKRLKSFLAFLFFVSVANNFMVESHKGLNFLVRNDQNETLKKHKKKNRNQK